MRLTFWGVRGSIPTPMTTSEYQVKLAHALVAARDADLDLDDDGAIDRFCASLAPHLRRVVGGNTSCVEFTARDAKPDAPVRVVADAGSGLRELGNHLMAEVPAFRSGQGEIHIFFSHTHWDHLMGLPFFVPIYIKGNKVHFYGCHDDLEERLRLQHDPRNFPVPFDALPSTISFTILKPGQTHDIAGFKVRPFEVDHPGRAFAYRVEADGRAAVYSSDAEYRDMSAVLGKKSDYFFRDADAIIFDAMYTFEEALSKVDWGHATGYKGVDLCVAEAIKRLILFHHEPNNDDARIFELQTTTIHYLRTTFPDAELAVELAREGWTLDLDQEPANANSFDASGAPRANMPRTDRHELADLPPLPLPAPPARS